MHLKFKWVNMHSPFGISGKALKIGRIKIASYGWNSIDREPSKQYSGHVNLPSLEDDGRVYGKDEQEVTAQIENIVMKWFEEILKGE